MTYAQTVFWALSSQRLAAFMLLFCMPLALLILYRLFLHPLSPVPGPLLGRITSIHLYILCYLGIECRQLEHYHRKYKTPVLRIAPNTVSISDGNALHPIYVAGGGFIKTTRYENFRVGGLHTIFSSQATAYRDVRAKAVSPIFAMARVRAAGERTGVIKKCVERFVQRLKIEKSHAQRSNTQAARVDVLDLAYRLMLDTVTGYLFDQTYGALDEQSFPSVAASKSHRMSALPFIFAIVEAGRFSLLPNSLFRLFNFIIHCFFHDNELQQSLERVHGFAVRITNDANPKKDDTYQSRLLAAGISKPETIAQCMAVMFAGTDSTAVKLVTIIFHLVQNPDVGKRLRQELSVSGKDSATDARTLPLLHAVVKEGLRLGMANPARFSRIVPPGGFEVGGLHLPKGTDVGLAPYVLHHNPELFREPFEFRPDRWLDEGRGSLIQSEAQKRHMERDLIPFSTGLRACIAKNFATHELLVATRAIVESGVLKGARTCTRTIELEEYFNVEIRGHKLEIDWL